MPESLDTSNFVPMPRSGKLPEYKVIDKILYCDGVKVMNWQLTDDECRKWLPEYYWTNRVNRKLCPICCTNILEGEKKSISGHISTAHPDFWAQHGEAIKLLNAKEAFDYVVKNTMEFGNGEA